ncbi:hypothetical protein [Sulfurospirillum multivorans]|uniref:Uncharacterized protein n=2 Tax=Sulfurospirillum multivorans TaxID=66821 RepID=A0AA86ANE6_SULMK|nr:hypothetical protein [Sulfurospirillum multivorans]AHJ14045.1 hypothetical protein SMUL_2807 [Sulfurospirillum multivorans DSM 12446]QEH07532.1 hypothetical protein SMN_2777 [Sulfurospirillum multivorans]
MLKRGTYLILFGLVLVLGSAIYKQITKPKATAQRIACHQEVVVFEKIYHTDRVEALKEQLKTERIHLLFSIQPSRYTPTQLFNYVDTEALQEKIVKRFGEEEEKSDLVLSVLLYENDLLDPGKKTKDAKKYAGYLVFAFHLQGELIYKIQIDFMDRKGGDIASKIECAYASVTSLH